MANHGQSVNYDSFPVADLIPHPKNTYFFDDMTGESWDKFLQSIKERGIKEPIIITQDNVIVSGHQRIRAAKELGIEFVQVKQQTYSSEDDVLLDLIELNIRQRGIMADSETKAGRRFKELKRIYGIRHGNNQHDRMGQVVSSKTSDQLAEELHMTKRQMDRTIQVANSDPQLQQWNIDGKITGDTIRYMMSQLTEEERNTFYINNEDVDKIRKSDVERFKSAQSEIANLTKQLNVKQRAIDSLLNKEETQTIKEVIPSDYESIKTRLAQLEIENLDLRSASTKQINIDDFNYKVAELNDTILSQRSTIQQLTEENRAIKERSVFDKNTIDKLRNEQYSGPAQEANSAYDFFRATERFVKEVVSPFHYDEIIDNNQNSICGDYIIRACNLLIDSANDILRRFRTTTVDSEVIDVE